MTASTVTEAVTTVTGAFGSITAWWPILIAVGFFVAGSAINLISGFFNKKKGRKGK